MKRSNLDPSLRQIRPNPTPDSRFFRSPGAMGCTCDAVYHNPAYQPDGDVPLLLRCQEEAIARLLLGEPNCIYVVKRCAPCADILRARVALGAPFEILKEEAL